MKKDLKDIKIRGGILLRIMADESYREGFFDGIGYQKDKERNQWR